MIDTVKAYSVNGWQQPRAQKPQVRQEATSTPKSSVWSKLVYPVGGLSIGASVMGVLAYCKSKKNIKIKYAAFLKDKLIEFLKTPEAKPYVKEFYETQKNNPLYEDKKLKGLKEKLEICQHYNFLFRFKELKYIINRQKEFCKTKGAISVDETALCLSEKERDKMKLILLDIEEAFLQKHLERTTKSCIKNSALGGLFGTLAGVGANFLKGNKSESK